jgi:xylan 1,4-beta-xylosidase
VELVVTGAERATAIVTHYRVDREHGNSYEAWKQMGSPQPPSAAQYDRLAQAGRLQRLGRAQRVRATNGEFHLTFPLPRQGVSLVTIQQ